MKLMRAERVPWLLHKISRKAETKIAPGFPRLRSLGLFFIDVSSILGKGPKVYLVKCIPGQEKYRS